MATSEPGGVRLTIRISSSATEETATMNVTILGPSEFQKLKATAQMVTQTISDARPNCQRPNGAGAGSWVGELPPSESRAPG